MVFPSELPRGLVYIQDCDPGYRREKKKNEFIYLDEGGKQIRNAEELERIEKLVIPPAWKSVWISPKSNTYLQVTGLDEKERKQYIYHEKWSSYTQKLKFAQLRNFGCFLPNLRKRYKSDLAKKNWPKEKVLALAVALLDELYLRIGNSQYTRKNNTYGLTTLRRRHLAINEKAMKIKYVGKSGISRMLKLTNKRLVRLLKGCSQLPGYELFRYEEGGKWQVVNSGDINEYINQESTEEEYFTAKYFRTWGANALCIKYQEEAKQAVKGTRKKPETELTRMVAKSMGHTVSTCKNHYLHPEVMRFCMEKDCERLEIDDKLDSADYKPEEKKLMAILKMITKD